MGSVSSPNPGADEPVAPTASVLVATSDSATRDLLRRILDVGAVSVIDASDGVEALALTRRLDLDLIVLDAFLAVLDGISVCSRIRDLVDIEQPPVLIVGLSSERAVEVALAAGADETLAKPLNPALIRNRTRALLSRYQEHKRLRLLERAVRAAPVGLTLLDARSSEYNVTLANPAFQRLSGHGASEILGRNLRLLKGPETDVAAMTILRDGMAAGRTTRVLLKNYRKDGSAFWNDLSSAPVLDASGRLTHFVAVQHDVTSIVEAPEHEAQRAIEAAVADRTRELDSTLARVEERRRFTETILNSMVSSILAANHEGIVTFANLAALRTLGVSLADCVGRSVVEIFGHHEGVAEVTGGHDVGHGEHRLDFPLITPGGARFYVGMSITRPPAEFREEIGFIFLFRNLAETIEDVTDPRLRQLAEEPASAPAAVAVAPAAVALGVEAGVADSEAARRSDLDTDPRVIVVREVIADAAPVSPPVPPPAVEGPFADARPPAATVSEIAAPATGGTVAESAAATHAGPPPLPSPSARPPASGSEPTSDLGSEATAEEHAARRRVLLALHYCAPATLVRLAIEGLANELGERAATIQVEPHGELPEVLVDRQQMIEALAILVANAAHRGGEAGHVLVRLERTEALADKDVHPGPSVRIDVVYPRALITESDLGSEVSAEGRQTYRRSDLAAAEKLIEANGGRLIRPLRDTNEQALSVLLRTVR